MRELSLDFGQIVLIFCAIFLFGATAIAVIESVFRERKPKLVRLLVITFGIFMLNAIALAIFAVLYSWWGAGSWQIWASVGITCLIGISTALICVKWPDEKVSQEVMWVALLLIIALIAFSITLFSMILEHAKW